MGCSATSAYRCRHGSDWNNVLPFLGPFFLGVAHLTTGVLINDFFQRCFLKVSYQFMFFNKVPCRAARVLDVDECPIHALIHDPRNYPKFYDPIYFPELYYDIFISSTKSASWHESDLNKHVRTCTSCREFNFEENVCSMACPFFGIPEFQHAKFVANCTYSFVCNLKINICSLPCNPKNLFETMLIY